MSKRLIHKSIPFILFAALLVVTGCDNGSDLPVDPSLLETDAVWSPDGSAIVFYRTPRNDSSGIWLVDSDGTNDRYLCSGMQADWSPDGERLVVATLAWNIYLIDKDGSNFEWLIKDGESNSPAWSPDGKWIAFDRPFVSDGLRLIDIETREETGIPGVARGDWAPDSRHIVHYWKSGYGEQAVKILDINDSTSRIVAEFDLYDDGALTGSARWSPNGGKILFEIDIDIWVIDTSGENLERLEKDAVCPNWSHDGKHIVYTPYEDDARLWIMDADGKNQRPLREE